MNASTHGFDRRDFLRTGAVAAGAGWALAAGAPALMGAEEKEPLFKISLAEWSFHKVLGAGKMDNLDFPATAKKCGVGGVEYVNSFFKDKARDEKYLAELKKRCEDAEVQSVLIMCDNEGDLGDPDKIKRLEAVEKHHKWVEAAKYLGCHSIRVNARSAGSREEQAKLATEGLHMLAEYAAPQKIGVIVENHGALSSDGQWLSGVIKAVDLPNCGTLPDFGNFYEYDRYQGVKDLMPFAKGVSAKSKGFDSEGNETTTDYRKMMKIVLDAGYHGFVGIEWEGAKPEEEIEGVMLTKRLLEKVLGEMDHKA